MAVAASAGPLAVAAMGVFAAGVGGALVAKAVKKFRNMSKSQGSFGSQASSTLEQVGNQLQKSLKNELGVGNQEEKKSDLSSLLSSFSSCLPSGSKGRQVVGDEREALTKEITEEVRKALSIDKIKENEEKLNEEITNLQGRFYGNLKKVMGDVNFCDSTNHNVIAGTDEVLKKLLLEDGLKGDDGTISKEAKVLKDIMKDYDKKGLKEQKLILKTLNDIFNKCDDSIGNESEKNEATKKKVVLVNIIKKNQSIDDLDKDKESEVRDLINTQKEKFDKDKVSKTQKDTARQQKKTDLGIQ
jgi:hypothetical protein